MGIALGMVWEEQEAFVDLGGLELLTDSRYAQVDLRVGDLPLKPMGFAWAKTDGIDLILGQLSFFEHFDVCFYRSRKLFEVALSTK